MVVLAARSVEYYDAIYVVTESKQTRLPIGASIGYTPPADSQFEWTIEVHDSYASVDEAASEDGHLSAYATEAIRGPKRGSGQYTQSVPRVFSTPP